MAITTNNNKIAMDKKSGGIRPIVVGYIWRCLAAKCASVHATNTLTDYFSHIQLGVGVPGGCVAAVHAARCFTSNMPPDNILVKMDFSNAFNCLHRDFMLERVNEVISELYNCCHLAYSHHSMRQFGYFSISSEEGPQQRDPLEGLLYCLHPSNLTFNCLSLCDGFHERYITCGTSIRQTLTSFVGREPK